LGHADRVAPRCDRSQSARAAHEGFSADVKTLSYPMIRRSER
jgi:hypothetical protein